MTAEDILWHAAYVAACMRTDRPDDFVGQDATDADYVRALHAFYRTGGTAERADEIVDAAYRVAATIDAWNTEGRP